MESHVLEALKASIKRWERKAEGRDLYLIRAEDCPLCKLFHNWDFEKDTCNGCPISQKTGEKLCGSTPYEEYSRLVTRYKNYENPPILRLKRVAQKEVDFLKSLLPTEP